MSSNPRDLAMAALNEAFRCSDGVIALEMTELRHLAATKTTGPGFLDFEKLTLGEIADCLAEAGLLVTPQASSAEREIEKVAQVLRDCKKVVRDERDYETFCAKRVLAALRGEAT